MARRLLKGMLVPPGSSLGRAPIRFAQKLAAASSVPELLLSFNDGAGDFSEWFGRFAVGFDLF